MSNTNCNSCNSCDSCNYCDSCRSCNSCDSCRSCDSCNYCDSCRSCDSCNYCNYCDYCRGLRQSEQMIFCLGEGQFEVQGSGYHKRLQAWNKDISEQRYEEILKNVREILSDFKLDTREDWTAEWEKVTASQWKKLAEIPEFDLEITKKITGLLNIPIEEEKTIEIEGKHYTLSEIKTALKK